MDSTNSMLVVYRYDSTTGTFTVPSGADGFYFFSVYLLLENGKAASFDIRINGLRLCTAATDKTETPGDEGQAACNAAAYASAGWLNELVFYHS